MPLRKLKQEDAESLTLKWVLHVRNYQLRLDKNRCVGCQICHLACPKEAIDLKKQQRDHGDKVKKSIPDIDLSKCNFCGICDALCPYGAIEVTINGDHILNVVKKESFPELVRDIKLGPEKKALSKEEWEEACPLGLIKIVGNSIALEVKIDKDKCPCCRVCEFKLPESVIKVRKFLQGKIRIDVNKCPEGCTDCLDVCPIDGALYLSESDSRVYPNELFCVYCGACKEICPVDEALELARTKVVHTPVKSGAWNKALERLTSVVDVSKELKTKGSQKARDSVKKRMAIKETQHA